MKITLASGYNFEGTVEELKILKISKPELFVPNREEVVLTQNEINEFSQEQLEVLHNDRIVSDNEYWEAKKFWRDCLIEYKTRIDVMLEMNMTINIPLKLLRCVTDMNSCLKDRSITMHNYYAELERRQRVLCKFNKIINQTNEKFFKNKSINFTSFVVLSNVFKCNKNHHIEQIQATVNILTPTGKVENHQVSAGYCVECGIYFILEADYNRLSQLGVLLCRKLTRDIYLSNGDAIINGDEFNTESLLHQIGYNVNSQDDLTAEQRQNLLKLAIDNNLYSISGLLSFLDWLIARNKKVSSRDMTQAISKWTNDRFFVASYQSNAQTKVGIDSITVKNDDLLF